MDVKLNLHTLHNPDCDILVYRDDKDTNITYGIYVKPYINKSGRGNYIGNGQWEIPVGTEFMEVYVGENYVQGSRAKSYSRVYYDKQDKMPKSRTILWFKLRAHYQHLKETGKLNETHKWE